MNNKVALLLTRDFEIPYYDQRILKEAISLHKNKYDVGIIYWKDRQEEKENPVNGFFIKEKVFQKKIKPKHPIILKMIPWIFYVLKSIMIIKKKRYGIIHCNDLDTLIIGILSKIFLNKKVVYDAHEDYPSMHSNSIITFKLMRLFEKIGLKFVDKIILAEYPYIDVMKKHYKIERNVHVVPNYPDLNYLKKQQKKDKSLFTILYVGGLGEGRGVEKLIEAFTYIKMTNLKLLVIGKATKERQNELLKLISDNHCVDQVQFNFKGVDYFELSKVYNEADLNTAILKSNPNWVLSIPTKVFEGMAFGLPTLVGEYDYLRDFILNNRIGYSTNPNDSKTIAETIKMIILDKNKIKFGNNAYEMTINKYNWDVSEKELLKCYDSLW